MQVIKNDLINELRNEKFYLEKDIVRLLNDNISLSYKDRVVELRTIFEKINVINGTLLTIDGYLTPPVQQNEVNNKESVENDVVTGINNEVPANQSQIPHQGQTHAE